MDGQEAKRTRWKPEIYRTREQRYGLGKATGFASLLAIGNTTAEQQAGVGLDGKPLAPVSVSSMPPEQRVAYEKATADLSRKMDAVGAVSRKIFWVLRLVPFLFFGAVFFMPVACYMCGSKVTVNGRVYQRGQDGDAAPASRPGQSAPVAGATDAGSAARPHVPQGIPHYRRAVELYRANDLDGFVAEATVCMREEQASLRPQQRRDLLVAGVAAFDKLGKPDRAEGCRRQLAQMGAER